MAEFKKTGVPDGTNKITEAIVDAALEVHKRMGPGLLEGIYESCLVKELRSRGVKCERQKQIQVFYGDEPLDEKLRLDLVVDEKVIVEIKSVERLLPIHEAQLLTYLKLTSCEVGLLINFNVRMIKDGIKRVALARSWGLS